jgi:hypothetical protein
LVTPKLLTCPGDTTRASVQDWLEFDGSSVSYELLSPSVTERDPEVVFIRCPIHHNAGLVDGSAQQLNDKTTRIEKVDGKFKIVRLQQVVPSPQP